jgi:hypothetical protein
LKRHSVTILWSFVLLCLHPVAAQQLRHRIILIGDAGELKKGVQPVTEAVLGSGFINPQTTVVYLGDNVYPLGLPAPEAANFEKYRTVLEAQLKIARQSPAQVYFIPGNHDWAKGRSNGLAMVKNEQAYIDSAKLSNATLLPANGCPGPEEIQLAPGVVLVVINSQWWLQAENRPGVTSDCDCKTGDEVTAKLKDIAFRHANDVIVLATHHPFQTNGPHGGYFTLRQHLFPLTDVNKNFWLPLPVLGSIYPVTRGVFGNIQDVKHPAYKKMIAQVAAPFATHASTFFVHGHEHTLQHLQYNNQNYIVSGSAIHTSPVKKGRYSKFAAAENGYVIMDVMDNYSVNLRYYSAANKLLYEYQQVAPQKKEIPAGVAQNNIRPGSVTASAGKEYDRVSGFKRLMFGKSYRKVWAAPVTFRVFDIAKEKGGLKILQRGGGKQTKSLRLEDQTGKQWVIRSINKNPISALPPQLRETFAVDIVQDQISAAHPYAPLVVPVLAQAAGIPHTKPELVWIPADTAFGGYETDFANTLCLFEEREPGINGKSYSTAKVLENLLEDNDNRIDQQAVLKARLFDMFICDWDRHEDQWRWGAVKTEKGKTYYPVPRDRDQAFFINNGFITGLAAAPHLVPSVQGMRKKYRNINSFNFSTRYFDRNFLNGLNESDWKHAAENMLAALTGKVIDEAVNQLPANIKALSGAALSKTLKARRVYFVQDILTYYRFLARTIEITGSNKRERFSLQPVQNDLLLLRVYKLSKNDGDTTLLLSREINPNQTKELRLYGMEGADQFVTDSLVQAKIKLRLIGGKGKDIYQTAGHVRTTIYDVSTEANDLSQAGGAAIRTGSNPSVNEYDRTAYQYNQNIPQFAFGFNPDDGLSLGAGIKLVRHGFRKSPKAVYQFSGTHSLSTQAFRFRASAVFNQLIGKTNVKLYADIKSPNNTTNFFGYGNASVFNNTGKDAFRFYRARYNLLDGGLSFENQLAKNLRLEYGAAFQQFSLEAGDNLNRFIVKTGSNGLANDQIFKTKQYINSHVSITTDSRNNANNPTRGLYWTSGVQVSRGLNSASRNTVTLQTDLRFYASLNSPARVVLASRFGAAHINGGYEFFQALQLGNHDNLRGFRNHRFAGSSMVYNNTELRIKLFDFGGYLLSGTVGLIGFNDVGRVWVKGESSATWHNTPGAGLYISPAGLVVISASVGFSKEQTLPFISLGFRF